MKYITLISLIFLALSSHAAPQGSTSYFASIKASEANVRTGPSVKYPIKWLYQKRNWPIEVIASFEGWRKIKDIDGDVGWIHESLLTRKRNVIINSKEPQEIYKIPVENADALLIAENRVQAKLLSCRNKWCKVELAGQKGWIQSPHLWGLKANEEVN